MRDDGEDNHTLAVDEIQHPMGELGQQGPSGSGRNVHDDLGGGLLFYPGKRDAQREEESFRSQNTALTIPSGGFGNVGPGVGSEGDVSGHNPICLRISASATAHDTPASGFWR